MFDSGASAVIQRLRTSGIDELTKLFQDNRDGLRLIISGRIQGKLAARFDASDIIQESFLRARSQLTKYLESPEIHPVVWMRIICRQLLSEVVRKQLRRRRSPSCEVAVIGDQYAVDLISDSLDSVGETMAREELYAKVSEIVTLLSETDREILEMRHRENMKFQQIADVLEMKMETAKKRYYRALSKIQSECRSLDV